jgi:hypothetical protein
MIAAFYGGAEAGPLRRRLPGKADAAAAAAYKVL